jgi:hypothetical protein
MHCSSCNRQIDSENDRRRGICFACHVKTIRLGFRHGKDNWNGPTEREIQRSYEESDAFKQGKIEKVPARAELI